MNKQIIILLLILGMSFITSCSIEELIDNSLNKNDYTDSSLKDGPLMGNLVYSNESKIADARLVDILTAIKDKDREVLRNMFSTQALDEIEDFDSQVDYLLSLFQGDVKSWEQDVWGSDASIEYGEKSVMIKSWHIVETDKDIYLFFMIIFSEDTINPDNEGLYTLRVIKAEDEATEFTYWQDMEIAGIYKPEE